MARLIAARNWAETPLGPIESWSQSLRTTVSLCLASNFPIAIAWGPHRIQIYNDGYRPICSAKHPLSLGQDFHECWDSAWPEIGEAFESAARGEARFIENERMFVDRNGYLEETFFTFSFSPIRDESGEVGGLFHPVIETTARMLSERRIRLLRDLAGVEAGTIVEACAMASRILAGSQRDLPFTMVYLSDDSGESLRLVRASGLPEAKGEYPVPTCFRDVLRTGRPELAESLTTELGITPKGPYGETPRKALVLRIERSGVNRHSGLLVAGLSTRLPFDEAYQNFCYLLAAQLSSTIEMARAREEERAQAEALAELDRAKTAFFSNVSHEFRTPLTLILGPLEEWLARGEAQVVAPREEVELVYRNGLRLLRLVNSLLDFARIEAGRAQASFEPLALDLLTVEFASEFRSAVEKVGLRLIVDCPPLPEPVYVDRTMWEKIVLNLLSNAFKFTLEGEIRVSLRTHDRFVELDVSDTGVGIAEADLPRLFERFFRAEGGNGRTYEGTGIGLSLTRELVRLHGGSIEVTSKQEEGTTFRVRLPLGSAHFPAGQIDGQARRDEWAGKSTVRKTFTEEASSWAGDEGRQAPRPREFAEKPRILLADDNPDMRRYMKRLLSAEYEVEVAVDGAVALEMAQANLPDLVLADVMMPHMDGLALLAALRADERTRSLPVILLSARAGEESRIEGLQANADDYLVKPFSAKELLARVRTNVELTRLRKEAARAEELRRTTVVIEQQRRLMDAVLSNTEDFNYIFDLRGRFIYVNRALLDLWHKTLDDAVGKNFLELGYPEALASQLQRQIQRVIETRQSVRDETPFAVAGGEPRHYEYIFVPVFALDGSVEAVAGSTRDTTGFKEGQERERRRQEQLRETARLEALGVMAGGIAHDFNNILAGVLGNACLLAEMTLDEASPLVQQIILAAERAADLVRQILIFSGKGRFLMEAVDLNKVVPESLGLLNVSISRSVILRTELFAGELTIEADRTQVQQIVMNLLINASDAIGNSPGEVTVKTSLFALDKPRSSLYLHTQLAAGLYAVLEVSDSGVGMTPETLRRIFDPFFTTKFTGRGLGLAAVLGILLAHGGDIEVQSQPGSGTRFRVLFPVCAKPLVSPAVSQEAASVSGRGYRILVVDDEPAVRLMSTVALARHGFEVITAENGAEAVDMLRRDTTISLVLLDLTMPVMTGEQAIPLLREVKPDIAIVLSSGYSESEVERQFASAGLQGFLHKPYTLAAIRNAVNRARALTDAKAPSAQPQDG